MNDKMCANMSFYSDHAQFSDDQMETHYIQRSINLHIRNTCNTKGPYQYMNMISAIKKYFSALIHATILPVKGGSLQPDSSA